LLPIVPSNVNEPPVPSASSYTFSVNENSGAGTVIGTLTASDPDALSTLSWTVSVWGQGASSVMVLNAQGALSVLVPPDFETQPSYTLTATVSDGLVSVPRPVTINIINLNEAPTLESTSCVTAACVAVQGCTGCVA
jgi:hypothetical protein